jgi:multiple sugar transport system substrate-binding protein
MTRTRRWLLHALAGWPVLTACTPPVRGGTTAPEVKFGEPVSVTFWHTQTGATAAALADLAGRFSQANGKNITLHGEYQGSYQQVFQKTMVAIQAGSPPEAALAYESMVQEYARAGAVVELDAYLNGGSAPLDRAAQRDLFPAYLETGRLDAFDRRLLSFPFAKALAVQYVDEDALQGAGWIKPTGLTFEEFRRQAAAVTRKDASGRTQVYAQHVRTDASYVDAFILANGGALLAEGNRRVRFDEPPGLEVFELWADLVRQGQAYTAKGFDYQTDFGQGKVAGIHDSSASRPFIAAETLDRSTNRERFRWSVGLIPQKDPAKPVTVTFGGNIVLFKSTPLKQAAAWEWVKFFSDREQTVTWSIASSYMPLRRSAADSGDLKALWQKSPQAEQAFRLAPYARPEPNIAAWQDIREVLANALSAVITQRSPPKAALDAAARQANRLIEQKP